MWKAEYNLSENLMGAIGKCVYDFKRKETEGITRKWGNTSSNILGIPHNTHLFLVFRVVAHALACLFQSGLGTYVSSTIKP